MNKTTLHLALIGDYDAQVTAHQAIPLALQQAGAALGLTPEQARRLAVGTFIGGATLAQDSPEPLGTLRERVTSKGGTTYAGLTVMREAGVDQSFIAAMKAAAQRAEELGDEFGR